MEIDNTSGFSMEQIATFVKHGQFRNEWRGRTVSVYAHPTEEAYVVTVGVGNRTTIVCVEPRAAYAERINTNNWATYY